MLTRAEIANILYSLMDLGHPTFEQARELGLITASEFAILTHTDSVEVRAYCQEQEIAEALLASQRRYLGNRLSSLTGEPRAAE